MPKSVVSNFIFHVKGPIGHGPRAMGQKFVNDTYCYNMKFATQISPLLNSKCFYLCDSHLTHDMLNFSILLTINFPTRFARRGIIIKPALIKKNNTPSKVYNYPLYYIT